MAAFPAEHIIWRDGGFAGWAVGQRLALTGFFLGLYLSLCLSFSFDAGRFTCSGLLALSLTFFCFVLGLQLACTARRIGFLAGFFGGLCCLRGCCAFSGFGLRTLAGRFSRLGFCTFLGCALGLGLLSLQLGLCLGFCFSLQTSGFRVGTYTGHFGFSAQSRRFFFSGLAGVGLCSCSGCCAVLRLLIGQGLV